MENKRLKENRKKHCRNNAFKAFWNVVMCSIMICLFMAVSGNVKAAGSVTHENITTGDKIYSQLKTDIANKRTQITFIADKQYESLYLYENMYNYLGKISYTALTKGYTYNLSYSRANSSTQTKCVLKASYDGVDGYDYKSASKVTSNAKLTKAVVNAVSAKKSSVTIILKDIDAVEYDMNTAIKQANAKVSSKGYQVTSGNKATLTTFNDQIMKYTFQYTSTKADSSTKTFKSASSLTKYLKKQTAAKKSIIVFKVKNYNPDKFYVGKLFYNIDKKYGKKRGYICHAKSVVATNAKTVTFTYYMEYPKYKSKKTMSKYGSIITSKTGWCKTSLTALKKAKKTIKFNPTYSYPYNSEVSLMMAQHREYLYGVSSEKYASNGVITLNYGSMTQKQTKSYMKKAQTKANAIVKSIITASMSDKEKLKAIYDYLGNNVTYVYDESSVLCHTAYSALVKKQAVCDGYTGAFNLLAKAAGIKSISVCGTADGGGHSWNMVKLGSKYYYLDITWDDDDVNHMVNYDYFLINETAMSADHTWKAADYDKKYLKIQ